MIENKSIIRVDARILKSISISFFYTDNTCLSVTLSEQDIVKITYIDKTKLVETQGRVNSINPAYNNHTNSISSCKNNLNSYNIELDCSNNYQSDIRIIPVLDIRSIEFVTDNNEDGVIEEDNEDNVIEDDEIVDSGNIEEKIQKAFNKWDQRMKNKEISIDFNCYPVKSESICKKANQMFDLVNNIENNN